MSDSKGKLPKELVRDIMKARKEGTTSSPYVPLDTLVKIRFPKPIQCSDLGGSILTYYGKVEVDETLNKIRKWAKKEINYSSKYSDHDLYHAGREKILRQVLEMLKHE